VLSSPRQLGRDGQGMQEAARLAVMLWALLKLGKAVIPGGGLVSDLWDGAHRCWLTAAVTASSIGLFDHVSGCLPLSDLNPLGPSKTGRRLRENSRGGLRSASGFSSGRQPVAGVRTVKMLTTMLDMDVGKMHG